MGKFVAGVAAVDPPKEGGLCIEPPPNGDWAGALPNPLLVAPKFKFCVVVEPKAGGGFVWAPKAGGAVDPKAGVEVELLLAPKVGAAVVVVAPKAGGAADEAAPNDAAGVDEVAPKVAAAVGAVAPKDCAAGFDVLKVAP